MKKKIICSILCFTIIMSIIINLVSCNSNPVGTSNNSESVATTVEIIDSTKENTEATTTTVLSTTVDTIETTKAECEIVEYNGQYYLVFNEELPHNNVSNQVISFYSLEEFIDTVKNCKFTEDQKKRIYNMEKDEHGYKIFDINPLLVPSINEDYYVGLIDWWGENIDYHISSNKIGASVGIRTKESFNKDYEFFYSFVYDRIDNDDIEWKKKVDLIYDDNKKIFIFHNSNLALKWEVYEFQDENTSITIVEGYRYISDTNPTAYDLYIVKDDLYLVIRIIEVKEKLELSWLLDIGLKPYVND